MLVGYLLTWSVIYLLILLISRLFSFPRYICYGVVMGLVVSGIILPEYIDIGYVDPLLLYVGMPLVIISSAFVVGIVDALVLALMSKFSEAANVPLAAFAGIVGGCLPVAAIHLG